MKPTKMETEHARTMDYDDSKIDDDLDKILQHIKEEQQNSMVFTNYSIWSLKIVYWLYIRSMRVYVCVWWYAHYYISGVTNAKNIC